VSHPVRDLSDTVHQRIRLGVLSVLAESRRADFGYLRDALEVTDGNLSKHLQVLEAAGYVSIEKTFEHRRPRTWISVTRAGRAAFVAEVSALRALLDRVNRGDPR
jgi:DNA-binding MarR family transcriptional regulator